MIEVYLTLLHLHNLCASTVQYTDYITKKKKPKQNSNKC